MALRLLPFRKSIESFGSRASREIDDAIIIAVVAAARSSFAMEGCVLADAEAADQRCSKRRQKKRCRGAACHRAAGRGSEAAQFGCLVSPTRTSARARGEVEEKASRKVCKTTEHLPLEA